jgi:protein tyrosine phosphatase (PTP) superfamily phosphohydrolase (DUF442 family)
MTAMKTSVLAAFLAAPSLLAATLLTGCSANVHNETKPVSPPIPVGEGSAYDMAMRVQLPKSTPQEEHGLHNVFSLSGNIISGSEPHGEEAFKELDKLGIKTILSVDGKVPDQQLADKYGMTYVHVPIQYKGISDDEMMKLAKTFREQEGPFYVHCFHGKHRGPAAAEVGRVVLDGIPRDQAVAEMRQWCGTAQSYEGLYRVIAEGNIPDAMTTKAFAWDFPAAHPFEGYRGGMVEVSRADDNLKFLSKRKWQPDAEHPDIDAVNEATKLASALERCGQLEEVASKPPDFQGWMADSVKQSAALRDALKGMKEGDTAAADKAYKDLTASCNACHDVYRND